MRRSSQFAAAATCFGLLLAGCTSDGDAESARPTVAPSSSKPDAALTLIADADPAAAAISTSRALYDSSDVVVLAAPDDQLAITLGASAAVALGVPMLLSIPGGQPADPLGSEFDRLGVTHVLAVGGDAAQDLSAGAELQILTVAADSAALAEVIGIELGQAEPVAPEGIAAALAALDPAAPVALLPTGAAAPEPSQDADPDDVALPEVTRPEAVTGTLVLATTTPESLPGIATARAAGVEVQVVGPDQLDPRSSSEAISTLSETKPDAVIALGTGYGAQQGLDWKLATAATGAQLPGGGQLLFQERMFVALYGYTEGGALGVLGEQDAGGAVQRAIETAAEYDDLVSTQVVPAFEIIATVASEFPGLDGNYSSEADISQLQPWVDAAGAAGIYVVLDLQPGRTDFLTQAMAYEPLLRLPHVGLALDPEWRLLPNQVHLDQIGFVSIEEVNAVVTWLADLTRANALPQKMLVLHQFQLGMIPDRELLDTTREELGILIHVDGNGDQGSKQATWAVLHEDPPANVYWGWKNFVDEDSPMLTPEQTIDQALPTPELITYQ
ncbi:MAG: hypothetical protein H0T99_09690 [Geodermatophilaceae bacterium]|nr:hypothetical protein [Geodermatophilaceae bacterium]